METRTRHHIVLCRNHYNPLGIIRSLGENGCIPDIILIQGGKRLIEKSRYAKNVMPVLSEDEALGALFSALDASEERPFVYTCDDKMESRLDNSFDSLNNRAFFFNAGERGRINRFMNKNEINQAARACDLNVLRTWVVRKGEIPCDIEYPVITKSISPLSGGWKDDVFVCANDDDLENAFKNIKSPEVLLQRYLKKKNELCLEGFSVNSGKDVFISIASIYNYLLPSSYSPYMTVSNFCNRDLGKKLANLIRLIRYEGIFEIEFLVDDCGQEWFCEVNFRNSTWSYASTCAGMPLPLLWAESMASGKINHEAIYRSVRNGFTAMVEPTDFKQRVMQRKTSIAQWLGDYLRADCKFYTGKKDPFPLAGILH